MARLDQLETLWCAWLAQLRTTPVDAVGLRLALVDLVNQFHTLKSVYPPATLHDCADGNDDNRVYLDRSVITSKE